MLVVLPHRPRRGRLRRRLLLALLTLLLLTLAGYAWSERQLRKAERALAQRDNTQARALLDTYLGVWPRSARAHFLAARAARRLRRYDEAAEHLRACGRLGGDAADVEVERLLADLQRGTASVEPILREKARAGERQVLEILEVLIQHYIDGYRLGEALLCLDDYLQRRPDDLNALVGRAYVWERFLYFADALADYRRAVELHPDSDLVRLKLAKTALITATPGEALEHFRHLAVRRADDPEVRLGLGQCYRRLGQTERARRLLDGLLAEHPNHVDALWERAQIALDQGDLGPAESWLRRAERLAPHDRKVNYSLFRLAGQQGRTGEAKRYRQRVQRIDADLRRVDRLSREVMKAPGDASLRCEMGLLFLRTGEEQEGVRWLELALRLDPKCQAARQALADYSRRASPPARP
jgi:tetratricopeptide (TPR) repeat protein